MLAAPKNYLILSSVEVEYVHRHPDQDFVPGFAHNVPFEKNQYVLRHETKHFQELQVSLHVKQVVPKEKKVYVLPAHLSEGLCSTLQRRQN